MNTEITGELMEYRIFDGSKVELKAGDKIKLVDLDDAREIDDSVDANVNVGITGNMENCFSEWVTISEILNEKSGYVHFNIEEDGNRFVWQSGFIERIQKKIMPLNEVGDYW